MTAGIVGVARRGFQLRTAVVLGTALLALAGAQAAGAETVTFTKPGCQVWTAPSSVLVEVEAVGSAGARGGGAEGGRGDAVSGEVARLAGEQLYVCVDEGTYRFVYEGTSYYGSGGGWSGAILGDEANHARVAVLAGGGGGASSMTSGISVPGGDAGKPGTAGTNSYTGYVCPGGGAGTLSGGGEGGTCYGGTRSPESTEDGKAGSEFQGGREGDDGAAFDHAGEGGGGYFGGGGGGTFADAGSGGGGGSDFCGNGTVECAVVAAAGKVWGAGGGAGEAHVTLTTTPAFQPTVAKVSPASGPASGDRAVIVTGANFSHVTGVSFGGVPASRYVVNAAGTELALITPQAAVAGTVDITVSTIVGTSKIVSKDHYKYLPVITGVSPTNGPTTGFAEWGREIISGAGFSEGFPSTTVFSYGGTLVTRADVECFSSTGCEVWVPPHAAGTVDVTATVNGVTSAKTKLDKFTYH